MLDSWYTGSQYYFAEWSSAQMNKWDLDCFATDCICSSFISANRL